MVTISFRYSKMSRCVDGRKLVKDMIAENIGSATSSCCLMTF